MTTTITTTNTCQGPPNGALPDIKGIETIPKDIPVAMIGGSNVSHPAMTTCCAPNAVQLLDGCYLWCKIPAGPDPTHTAALAGHDIFQNFTTCLRLSGLSESENVGIGGHIPTSMGSRLSDQQMSSPIMGMVGLLWVSALVISGVWC